MARPKLFDFTRADVEAAFEASRQRVLRGEDMENPRPAFDPQQAREISEAAAGGRKADIYAGVLERHGFVFVPVDRLPRFYGVVAQPEGRWSHEKLGFGFYPSDLPKMFPEGPEQLDTWLKQRKLERRLLARKAPKQERRRLLNPQGRAL
jgi:hypothetical protein